MTKVRSEYIKKLMAESHSLEDKLKDVAQSTINTILEEKTNKNLRQILSEDENSFSEEEVEDDDNLDNASEPSEEEGADVTTDVDDEEGTDGDEWDDLEKFKDEDGEYDLRDMDKDELVKVLKVMNPDDAVRIVKNDDDTLTVTDEADGTEYELELDDEEDEDVADDEVVVDEPEDEDGIEIEVSDEDVDDDVEEPIDDEDDEDEFEIELDEQNLGYTDNYQKQTAMTTPDNHEPADSKSTYSMDGGVPTGTEKPWVGGKKKSPFNNEVNEECGEEDVEEPIEEGSGEFGKVAARVSGKQHRNNSSGQGGQPYGSRHNSVAGEYKDYEESVSESIKKKANEIFVENKQLKSLMGKLKKQVDEAIVVNQSLSNIVKIINENATTVNEKKDILRRFNECTTREESNKLYNVISEELKRDGKTHTNVTEAFNSQLSESRDRAVETPMYQSQDLSDTLSFMKRLNAIK